MRASADKTPDQGLGFLRETKEAAAGSMLLQNW